jgi:hypothetical protein
MSTTHVDDKAATSVSAAELRKWVSELDHLQGQVVVVASAIEAILTAARLTVVGNDLEATDVRLSVNRAIMGLGSDPYAELKRGYLNQAINAVEAWQRREGIGNGTTGKGSA